MGARGKNFFNELARRYGFEAESEKIQDLYLAGRKAEATAAIPEELLRGTSLVGTADEVKARIAAYWDAGVRTLAVSFAGVPDPGRRLSLN
jgi:alkanesulfonate monooxygenase SsuD/methylene tetrahydromethanopterin reductase-like flavin-dependent oxidoreductase (luciferase family)